jgi:murein DD-endopeptidase MepM/ murein hydrolase activator NlpD
MFLSEMLRGMRESLLDDEQQEGLGAETMTDTVDTELGRALSAAGGLGLARIMLDALTQRGNDASLDSTRQATPYHPPLRTAPTVVAADNGAAHDATDAEISGSAPGSEALSEPMPVEQAVALPGPVTSRFGWRADPFTGRPQFHAGTDVRLAYGQEVQSVAPGRVQSVGERAGYGLTVVIDHGSGLETRYAHLSATSVQPGETVQAGQVVARSGNSGRSTGPHLHLEARQHGRAIEMATLLKSQGMTADSYADDRSTVRSSQ